MWRKRWGKEEEEQSSYSEPEGVFSKLRTRAAHRPVVRTPQVEGLAWNGSIFTEIKWNEAIQISSKRGRQCK